MRFLKPIFSFFKRTAFLWGAVSFTLFAQGILDIAYGHPLNVWKSVGYIILMIVFALNMD